MRVIDIKHFIIRSNAEVHGFWFAVNRETDRLMRIGMKEKAAFLQAMNTVKYVMKR